VGAGAVFPIGVEPKPFVKKDGSGNDACRYEFFGALGFG